ncbi:AVAST type 1 anti-phage system protein Avs1c [Heyndrickxia acidiproducens]|uniref:AVAST type 1 anti-phage system protein Avs1c n=1 Tax=Heyndrickxia acidiproducens TaxID=1121084 RepID=UPI00035E5C22|nr:AVAST type 1 anti-phage system protein Avs1c [Heyndrickxia acidiproducens]
MNIKPMDTPKTRQEFERNFHIAAEQFIEGKMNLVNVRRIAEGLSKVRKLPNNRIDFLSVDETARLHVNMASNFQDSILQDEE